MVSVITVTMRPQYMEQVFQNYQQQTYPVKELIIILNRDDMNIAEWKEKAKAYRNVHVYQLPEHKTYGECLNYAAEKSTYNHDILAIFDDDDYYAPQYLMEAVKAMDRSGAPVVGKGAVFVYFEANRTLAVCHFGKANGFTDSVAGATLVFRKEVLKRVKFPHLDLGPDKVFKDTCNRLGIKMYGTDRYNYTCLRRGDLKGHTWKIDQDRFIRNYNGRIIAQTDDYKKYVIK